MKNLTLIIVLLVISSNLLELNAQTTETDSLENLLQQHQNKDTIRVNLLNETANKLYSINIDKTLQYAEEAGKLADKLSYAKGKAESLRLIGIYNLMKSDYPQALEYLQKSLKISEELGDKSGTSKSYNYIGIIYHYQGDYPQALEYHQKSLKIKEELGDISGVSGSYNNIGLIYRYQGDYLQALEYHQKSLKIKEELGDKGGISKSYNNIGNIYKSQGDYSQALEYYQKSLNMSIEIGDRPIEAMNNKELGSLYLKQKKTKEAYSYSKKAYIIAEEVGEAELLKESSEILAKSCDALGLYKEAYKYFVVFKTMNDSLYNEEKIKKITGLEYQYKYEKEKQAAEQEQQKKDAVQAEKAKRQRTVRNSFIAGFVFMVLLVLLVLRSFLQKRKANNILAVQKEQIETQSEELKKVHEMLIEQTEKKYKKLDVQRQHVEETNRLKSEFLSNMSHELRTPLNSIIVLSNVLASQSAGKLSDEENNYLEIVERNGKKLLELINEILDLSKIESGKADIITGNISTGQLLDMIKDSLIPLAEEKKIALNLKLPKKLPMVVTDESKLYQVFTNVIGNAVKFTEKGSVDIIVKNDTKNVYVDIRDTGIGISEEALPNIFDEFRQADGTTARQFEGTGLGLAIANKTMKLLFGTIRVKSELGKGSVFTVTIPVKWMGITKDTSAEKKSIPIPTKQKKKKLSNTELPKVLVVEDNADNMITIKAILKSKYEITESYDGKDSLNKASEELPDIILLDMTLPKMDGIEVVRILKSKKKTSDIPVIALTASAMKADEESFIKAGCNDFVSKPIDRNLLFSKMDEWL